MDLLLLIFFFFFFFLGGGMCPPGHAHFVLILPESLHASAENLDERGGGGGGELVHSVLPVRNLSTLWLLVYYAIYTLAYLQANYGILYCSL